MKQKRVYAGSLTKSIVWAVAVGITMTIVMSMVVAAMVSAEKLSETGMNYAVMIILLLASYAAAYTACRQMNRQRLSSSLLAGTIYFGLLLMMTALLFDAKFQAVGETALLIICGCVLAAMWTSRKEGRGKFRKLKISNR